MTTNTLYQRDIITTKHLTLKDIQLILMTAKKFAKKAPTKCLANKIIAHCFFEPSTRTRLSFETAALRLGGQNIGFTSDEALSIKKGETLHDTMRIISAYADLIVIRHPAEGSAALAADIADCPVINAGDGANQHPTQALVDLFTMQECQNEVEGLSIALVGDLKYGRTVHSLTQILSHFGVRLYLVAPEKLSLPDAICDQLKKSGIRFSFHHTMEEVLSKVDILYMTRIQQERISETEFKHLKNRFILRKDHLSHVKPNLKIMHPLPRVSEIHVEVDDSPHAIYFQQAKNGVYVREALLSLLLNEDLP